MPYSTCKFVNLPHRFSVTENNRVFYLNNYGLLQRYNKQTMIYLFVIERRTLDGATAHFNHNNIGKVHSTVMRKSVFEFKLIQQK